MFGARLKHLLHTNRHSLSTVIAILLGLSLGLLVRNHVWPDADSIDKQTIRYFELPGLLYLRTFSLLLAPLLIASLTTSFFVDKTDRESQAANNNNNSNSNNNNNEQPGQQSGNSITKHQFNLQKVSGLTFIFFIAFSTSTILIGSVVVSVLRPGSSVEADLLAKLNRSKIDHVKLKQDAFQKSHYQTDSVYNILLSIFPDNPLTPFFMKSYEQTEFIWPTNLSEISGEHYLPKNKIRTSQSYSPNMLGICVLSLSLGFILSKLPPYKTETIRNLLLELDLIVKYVLDILIRIMPFGMFCWMFTESLKMKSLNTMVSQLIYFYLIAIALFLFIWFIFYPVIYFAFTRKNPYRIHRDVLPAYVIAFASSSSALALPVTMECMEQKQKLSKIISKMVLPLGMTINMNGTAMYYPMVAIFVSQIKQVPQNFISLTILGLFALVMSMGFPGVPASGTTVVYHLAFCSVLGIEDPQDIIVLVLTFDWIFERIRTITNIMGDCFVAKCVEKLAAVKVDQTGKDGTATITDEDMALNNFEKQ